jgi:uncharacterized protein (DUF1015 family)
MDIKPIRGWRYAQRDISSLIAPPYDILNGAEKAQFLAGNAQNIVAVDMPHVPPKELGPDAEYAAAAAKLGEWKAGGVLAQDAEAALYVYEQSFPWGGRTYCRRAMLCGVRAGELGRDVIPHEHVFAGPLADRLRLTEHTHMQLSPIFGFYDDPGKRVGKALAAAAAGRPVAEGVMRGVAERLWKITEPAVVADVAKALQPVPVFIADGHHRYTTALNYVTALAARQKIAPTHEANFVMFALVARDDPGLLILPTHRLFTNLRAEGSVEALAAALPEFSWRKHRGGAGVTAAYVEGLLADAGPLAVVLVSGTGATVWVARLEELDAMRKAAPDQIDEWRVLPPAILHKLIVDKGVRNWSAGAPAIEYTAYTEQVLEACRAGRAQLGACLPGIGVAAVEAVAQKGAAMPHKSTYFYPKLATGVVLKPLE